MTDANAQANIQAVRKIYADYKGRELDSVLAALAPDVHWFCGGTSRGFPPFGLRKGTTEVGIFFGDISDALSFDDFKVIELYGDKDKVFATGHYAMTMKKTGRKAESDWVHIFTLRDGKVTDFREFLDTAAVADAYQGR